MSSCTCTANPGHPPVEPAEKALMPEWFVWAAASAVFAALTAIFAKVGLAGIDDRDRGSSHGMQSGMQSGSRFGLRGREDLGGGLYTRFQLESGTLTFGEIHHLMIDLPADAAFLNADLHPDNLDAAIRSVEN